MKKIIYFIVFSTIIAIINGCCTSNTDSTCSETSFGSGFNSDHYVWENLYFPTNRVMDRK